MKTDQLIEFLAERAGSAEPAGDGRQLLLGVAMALPVMAAAVWATLGFVPLQDWIISSTAQKLIYGGMLLIGGILLLRRLGRPGSGVALAFGVLGTTLATAAGVGLWGVLRLPAEDWAAQVFGSSSPTCPVAILALSIPALVAMLRGARLLAPTHLRLTGAAAGLAAGALAAVAYSLGCTEGALTFVAVWYTLGVALATALGAAVGPRALRW